MSRNDAEDYAQRLYARVPAHYRVYDAEQGLPLLALLRVVGEQVANLRQDLDALWDNFFIETCDDWAVPYITALVGTNLLAHPVGQSNRLYARNTVRWRRSKGTPAMLDALAQAISGWPSDMAEFFQALGWSQNLNHLRLDHPITVDLRDPYRLALLGRAADPFAHAADFHPARALDQARVTPDALGVGRAAWGTPGRYQIKNLGIFARRLQTFAVRGATPASGPPGPPAPTRPACFTFDPLFRDAPLFVEATGAPLSRADFGRAPWETFGADVGIRQFGVLLASEAAPAPQPTSSTTACTFGGAGAGLALDHAAGLRLLDPRALQIGGAHFVIAARWQSGPAGVDLGALSTLHAGLGDADAYHPGTPAVGPGQLVITVRTGRAGLGWPGLAPSPPARFPGAVLAVRAARTGPPHAADALYVYLPAAPIRPADTLTYFIADDGSAYTRADLAPAALARASAGQIYPPRPLPMSTSPADQFLALNLGAGGLRLTDPSRFGGAAVLVEADLFTGAFQPLGAIATIDQTQAGHPDLQAPDPWPALTYAPSKAALGGALPTGAQPGQPLPLLSINLRPLSGNFIPQAELIVANRAGQSLLVYLPELSDAPADGVRLFVADDGSTYYVPADSAAQISVRDRGSYSGLTLARAGGGQVLPIAGVWPLQQRRPVAIDLCRCERNGLLQPGELGVDPQLGRFALAPDDPAIGQGGLSVDYVEAFSDQVGARTFDRRLNLGKPPTRLVAQSGDAVASSGAAVARDHIHASLADALAHAADGDVIEIVDSATYPAAGPITLNAPAVKTLTIRAGPGQRPCLTFYGADGAPTISSIHLATPLDHLELSGLLVSGGPIRIESAVTQLLISACTLDPRGGGPVGSLLATDADPNHQAEYLLCRCITGGVRADAGVGRVTIADSIVDQRGGMAISGVAVPGAQSVQLERVTVFGQIRCDMLNASECLLDDIAVVDDRQSGCIRFSRYERGSVLPRRYQCVPSDAQASAGPPPPARCLAPIFNARRFGRPDYAQLAAACPPELLTAGEEGAEVGAFAGALTAIRLGNQEIKLREFLPVGLSAPIIAET